MKRIFALAASTAFMLAGVTGAADDAPKVKTESGSATIIVDHDGKLKIEKFEKTDHSDLLDQLPEELREKVKQALQSKRKEDPAQSANIVIRGFFIGPDGAKHAFGGDDKLPSIKVFETLPQEVRDNLEKAMKEHTVKGDRFWNNARRAEAKEDVDVEIKGVIIGPDGKRREVQLGPPDKLNQNKLIDGLPEHIRMHFQKAIKVGGSAKSVASKAIIIGPDGKMKELDLNAGNVDFDDGFEKMPKETQEAIKQALKSATVKLSIQNETTDRQSDVTNRKILEKLEQMQKQINDIRKRLDE